MFFESEIKGNLKNAMKIQNQHRFSEITEIINKKMGLIEVFSGSVISIKATIGKILGRIVGYSSNAPAVLGYSKTEFNYLNDVTEIMPITLARVHHELIRFVMITSNTQILLSKRYLPENILKIFQKCSSLK